MFWMGILNGRMRGPWNVRCGDSTSSYVVLLRNRPATQLPNEIRATTILTSRKKEEEGDCRCFDRIFDSSDSKNSVVLTSFVSTDVTSSRAEKMRSRQHHELLRRDGCGLISSRRRSQNPDRCVLFANEVVLITRKVLFSRTGTRS